LKFVAIAPEPDEVEEALPALVASATCTPKAVVVSTLVVPPVVTVVVTTEVAVVEAEQPVQVVHGAEADQVPDVQPDQVLGGQPLVPHQLVHGPEVQALLLSLAQGPHPPCPNGPTPPAPDHPLELLPPHPGKVGAPVVTVAHEEAILLKPDGSGCAEVSDAHSEEAVGQDETLAPEVQLLNSLPMLLQADVSVGKPF